MTANFADTVIERSFARLEFAFATPLGNVSPHGRGAIVRQPAGAAYLTSTALAALGVNILVTVLFKQAYDLTGDELWIGLLGLAQFVPALVLVLVSGWAADRFDRRRVTAVILGDRALCALALVLYSRSAEGRSPRSAIRV